MITPQLEAWQCYVDHEMSPSEEAALLARLSVSERSELLAARLALDALGRTPRMPAPADFACNVMAEEHSGQDIVSMPDETQESITSRMLRARQMFEQLYGKLS